MTPAVKEYLSKIGSRGGRRGSRADKRRAAKLSWSASARTKRKGKQGRISPRPTKFSPDFPQSIESI